MPKWLIIFHIFLSAIAFLPLKADADEQITISLSSLQRDIKQNLEKYGKISPEIENLYSLGTVEGFIVDNKSYDIIIFGKKSEKELLTLDDFIVALRCAAYSNESPGVTIDPRPKAKDPYKIQDVRFFGPVENTGRNLGLSP